jgi:hypothetical protein
MPESDSCECCGRFLMLEGATICPKCENEIEEEVA